MGRDNGNLNTLKPQPGQTNSYNPTFHPLPGEWAKQQLEGRYTAASPTKHGSGISSNKIENEINRARAAEEAQHRYWEEWQGVTPGKPVYEDPRAFQNTLLPSARFGTDGRGY